jgi:hypothetical protein
VQRHHVSILTPLSSCVRSSSEHEEWALAALDDIYTIAQVTPPVVHSSDSGSTEEETQSLPSPPLSHGQRAGQGVVLITQHYREPSAGQDVAMTLVKNLMNPHITDIYLFNDEEFDLSSLPHAHKLHQVLLGGEAREGDLSGGRRLLFQTAFDFAATHLHGRTVIIGMCMCMCVYVYVCVCVCMCVYVCVCMYVCVCDGCYILYIIFIPYYCVYIMLIGAYRIVLLYVCLCDSILLFD